MQKCANLVEFRRSVIISVQISRLFPFAVDLCEFVVFESFGERCQRG